MRLDNRQLATVLASLRSWQFQAHTGHPIELADVATDGGAFEPLSCEEIDDLCEALNFSTGDLSDTGRTRAARILELARNQFHDDGFLEIDDNSEVHEIADSGAYVQAWCWVDFNSTPVGKLEPRCPSDDLCEKACPYVVVLNPGTDNARPISSYATAKEAYTAAKDACDEDGPVSADVAKRQSDGSLTYEF